jgi:single-strand DNA-binding protein
MGSVNKAILVGNLGRDAEMRFTSGGTPVATVSLATTERFTDRDGQKREDTQWHRIVIWGKTAESLHEYLTKGKQIYVEGRIQTREWTDKEGKQNKTTEIRADRIVLLGGGGGGGGGRSGGGGGSRERYSDADHDAGGGGGSDSHVDAPHDDDIPF